MKLSRVSSRRWLCLAVAMPLVLALLGYLCIWIVAEHRISRIRTRLDMLVAELSQGDGGRSVLHGSMESGNAWEYYALALDQLDSLDYLEREIFLEEQGKVDQARTAKSLEKQAKVIEWLRRGAGRSACMVPR